MAKINKTMKVETRNFTRKVVYGHAAVLLSGGAVIRGRTKDLSLGGVGLQLADQIATGTNCSVLFEAPLNGNMVRVSATAKVIYCILRGPDDFRVGLQFVQLDAANNKTLAELML
ncbi:MAG TPA: PilZ domain-containing protein [Noviherbaspirillum sp.]|uniref:PilZ domain-containing protein n=1 Tax=Noviherbaspirillum sp. TaxID=1926288 RepID=UPI002B49AD38|nr:PilZ domain-containing protein [Noviherbaspirillum sp.]HJV84005.1 PilZ domain-containing protein [Noviherbaspirillum sp.]